MTTIEDLITRSKIQFIIGYLKGISINADEKICEALEEPIEMLKDLIGEKEE